MNDTPRYLYAELANLVSARRTCDERRQSGGSLQTDTSRNANEWYAKHEDRIESLVKEYMPSGSGFDSGTSIDLDKSHAGKLVFHTSYHHMNDVGYYDGWTEHQVTVTPAFVGDFRLRIGGPNRNDIKEVIHEEFEASLHLDLAPIYEWQRLKDKFEVDARSRWIEGGSVQLWDLVARRHTFVINGQCDVCHHYGDDCTWNKPTAFRVEFKSFLDARATGIQMMREWEAKEKTA